MKKQKVVFHDAGKEKVTIGSVTFEEGFVKVVNKLGTIFINKENVTLIKDIER